MLLGVRRGFKHDVAVGPADTESAHAGFARARPGRELRLDLEAGLLEAELRVELLVVGHGHERLLLHHVERLDEPGDPGRAVRVADVPLDGPNRDRLRSLAEVLVGLLEPGDLDGVADLGPGAVALDVANVLR